MQPLPCPTPLKTNAAPDFEQQRWQRLFTGDEYFYGHEPGPLVRRAVRYHRAFCQGGTALDAGCGEGQDLAFLASSRYDATGLDFVTAGLNKARNLLAERNLQATFLECDLRNLQLNRQFDLVVASNSLQFLGKEALACLNSLKQAVAPGGVIALSLFAREEEQRPFQGTLYLATLTEILALFENWQPLEATELLQWNLQSGEPQPFVTLIARNIAPVRPVLHNLK